MLLNAIWLKISRHIQYTPITKLLAIGQLYSATVHTAGILMLCHFVECIFLTFLSKNRKLLKNEN